MADEQRPPIPADLKRRVLVEAGHRCAIPTCRQIPVEVAHIVPWSENKEHEFENLIALCPNCHDLYDKDNNAKVGSDNGYCFRTVVGKAWECAWTNTMADGQITVQGPYYDSGDSMVSVIGGTGKYANARGEMKLHARNDKGTEYDFVFALSQ